MDRRVTKFSINHPFLLLMFLHTHSHTYVAASQHCAGENLMAFNAMFDTANKTPCYYTTIYNELNLCRGDAKRERERWNRRRSWNNSVITPFNRIAEWSKHTHQHTNTNTCSAQYHIPQYTIQFRTLNAFRLWCVCVCMWVCDCVCINSIQIDCMFSISRLIDYHCANMRTYHLSHANGGACRRVAAMCVISKVVCLVLLLLLYMCVVILCVCRHSVVSSWLVGCC